MAGVIEKQFGLTTRLTPGNRGEFTVWLKGQKVAEKGDDGFPTDQEVLAKIGQLTAR